MKVRFTLGSVIYMPEDGQDDLNENKITRLDVFIYPKSGDECVFYQRIEPAGGYTGTAPHSSTLGIRKDLLTPNAEYTVYAVANYAGSVPSPAGLTLTGLKGLVVSGLDPDRTQSSFLMDGASSPAVLNNGRAGNAEIDIALKRAASKIRVGFAYATGYEPAENGAVTKKLINYAAAGTVVEGGDAYRPALNSMGAFTGLNTGAGGEGQIVVYSYSNDWNDDPARETHLVVNVPLRHDGRLLEHNYYRVPVNFRLSADDGQDGSRLRRLERNLLYDVTALIDRVGSADPGNPADLAVNYTVAPWGTKEIIVDVKNIHYLYVHHKDIALANETFRATVFESSSPVTVTDIMVNGRHPVQADGVVIDWDRDVKEGGLRITSALPDNFVEKTVTFTVRNQQGLAEQVKATQYPALYIGSHTSGGTPAGGDEQDNKNMYIMSSLVANYAALPYPDEFEEEFPKGYSHWAVDEQLGRSYTDAIRANAVMGYPQLDAQGRTLDNEANNRRISPRFMLASQVGTTNGMSYDNARDRCADYFEEDDTEGRYHGDWRMPTLYELYLIDVLQNVKKCAVKKILEGRWYWSARASGGVQFMDPRVGNSGGFSETNSAVRCVRDIR